MRPGVTCFCRRMEGRELEEGCLFFWGGRFGSPYPRFLFDGSLALNRSIKIIDHNIYIPR